MREYVSTSLATNLFFARIMKEHSLFLLASFPAKETEYIERADRFREAFEKLLEQVVQTANGLVPEDVLSSGEVVTEFTANAERQTTRLTGIPINIRITRAGENLRAGFPDRLTRETVQMVRRQNQRALQLVNGLISFKENIRNAVTSCELYTTNYPLLIEHITREARLYRQILMSLEQRGRMPRQDRKAAELFWNQIMMEHAQFIRGLLDPTECELMNTANDFAGDYCRLIEEAKEQDDRTMDGLTRQTLKTTMQYRDFKAAGTQGILGCEIRSIIVPLLADHVLREANHYLRILE